MAGNGGRERKQRDENRYSAGTMGHLMIVISRAFDQAKFGKLAKKAAVWGLDRFNYSFGFSAASACRMLKPRLNYN